LQEVILIYLQNLLFTLFHYLHLLI